MELVDKNINNLHPVNILTLIFYKLYHFSGYIFK